MNNQVEDQIHMDERLKKKTRESHPLTRKSRSISRYFLGSKHSSIDITTHDIDITRCLSSFGIFDSYELWTSVTLFRDYRTSRRLLIITNKNELIIGKTNQKQSLLKIKYRIDLNRVWLYTNIETINETYISEITSLNYYDHQRSLILGWPLAENFLIEFDSKDIRDIWYTHIQSNLNFWWQLNHSNTEHVRIVIDQNQECDQNNNNSSSFLIRKVISIRPQETVRDLIKKCIDACHLRDACVDNYTLFVLNDSNTVSSTHNTNNINQLVNSSPQSNQTQLIPLIGHEYPYAIKMKHLKTSNQLSFDSTDDRSSLHGATAIFSNHNTSTTSLNNISINSHDFELRKRDNESQNKKHRFFHKRKTKDHTSKSSLQQQQQQYNDDYYSLTSVRSTSFFGLTFDELMKKYNNQMPPIIQKLLEILYYKGPDTTGIFRKVANARAVRDAIDKIERNIILADDDLHPILAAGIFKHFLRTLPEPIFDSIQYENWKKCLRILTPQEKTSFARKSILSTLTESNHLLLKGLICILYRISQNSDTNGMNAFNLGLCISNSLFKTESTTIASGKQEADVMSSIVEFLILNSTSLFGSDVTTCIADKHIIVHHIPNLTRPTASSIESLDEVESSPHVPIVNRSRDSGLATSDQPFNDDSSEISEHFRRNTSAICSMPPNWTTSIACGTGTVLSSIIIPTTLLSLTRYRNSKNLYKPSKQFMEREKLTNDTTDDSDRDEFNGTMGDSSVRSSSTTVNNISIGKLKRSKPILRHSSLGNNEYHQKYEQQIIKEAKRISTNNVKRASSLKQFHHVSDEADDDDEQNKTLNANNNNNNNNNNNVKKRTLINTKKNEQLLTSTPVVNSKHLMNEQRRPKLIKSKTTNSDDESMTTRSTQIEQQDLDLTSEPLSTVNQRYNNITATRSASFNIAKPSTKTTPKTFDSSLLIAHPIQSYVNIDRHSRQPANTIDGRSRHNGPLAATTNQIYTTSRNEHHSQTNSNTTTKTERDRTFIHHSDCRPFKLGTAIQMKPIDDIFLSSNGRCRPCHRQNALRYKSIDQEFQTERQSRPSEPVLINQNHLYSNENSATNISRYQSIERRVTTPIQKQQLITKPVSFDVNDELRPADISWSVREKAKLFEHINHTKLSTGRENYV